MKKNYNTLIFLCDSYPVSSGEFFIDDEMQILSSNFERIIVVLKQQKGKPLNRFLSQNTQIHFYNAEVSLFGKISAIPQLFCKYFLSEFLAAYKHYKKQKFVSVFKIMYMDAVRANKLKNIINDVISANKIEMQNVLFYSYWHDYKALTLALLKNNHKELSCIARAHRWDNFKDSQNPPYLPFKQFIINNLSQTFTISQAGKNEFLKYGDFRNKITVSHLGKLNSRLPLISKNDMEKVCIVSCSNIIPVKRVNLIVDILNKMNLNNITWIHFGDGYLRKNVEEYAAEKLKNIHFEFRGIVPNSEILDFYAQNYVDLFVNLSESEGIPVSIMEAMSAAIPVVATNVGGTSEIVNAGNGFLIEKDFNMENTVNIINKYLQLSADIQQTYRQNAYDFWKENYKADKNYTAFCEQIKGL